MVRDEKMRKNVSEREMTRGMWDGEFPWKRKWQNMIQYR
jgi:hypothetical protein